MPFHAYETFNYSERITIQAETCCLFFIHLAQMCHKMIDDMRYIQVVVYLRLTNAKMYF